MVSHPSRKNKNAARVGHPVFMRMRHEATQSCYHQKPMSEEENISHIEGQNPHRAPEPAALVRTEAAALEALATRLEGPMAAAFDRAVELILRCGEERGRVVVTGMGKSLRSDEAPRTP